MINLWHYAVVPELIAPATMSSPGLRAIHTRPVTNVNDQAKCLTVGSPLLNGPPQDPTAPCAFAAPDRVHQSPRASWVQSGSE